MFLDNSQLDTHKHPVKLLCTSDQLVPKAATYTKHNKHKRLGPAIPEINQLQSHALDRRPPESAANVYRTAMTKKTEV